MSATAQLIKTLPDDATRKPGTQNGMTEVPADGHAPQGARQGQRRGQTVRKDSRIEPLTHFAQEALIVHVASPHRAVQHHARVLRVLQLLHVQHQHLRPRL